MAHVSDWGMVCADDFERPKFLVLYQIKIYGGVFDLDLTSVLCLYPVRRLRRT